MQTAYYIALLMFLDPQRIVNFAKIMSCKELDNEQDPIVFSLIINTQYDHEVATYSSSIYKPRKSMKK